MEYRPPEWYVPYPAMTTLDWSNPADPVRLANALSGWRDGDGPMYGRLAGALRRAIDAFEVPAGGRLAPERELAGALGVSRSTVIAAYDALAKDGLVERRQGSGTWVRDAVPQPADGERHRRHEPGERSAYDRTYQLQPLPGEGIIDLTVAGPDIGSTVREAMREALESPGALLSGHGYTSHGLPELRLALAAQLTSWGVPTTPDEVMVTSGAHQAISLIVAHVLRPGDVFAMEDPTYAGAIDVAGLAGTRATGMALDGDGVLPDEVERAISRRGARLVHIIPTGQNPTGTVMSARRRGEIARLVAELGVPVIEDTVFEAVGVRRRTPAPLAAQVPGAPVIMVGSLSKIFWGGLRVGWLRAPGPLLNRLVRLKMVTDHGSSIPAQVAALHLLERFDEQRDCMRLHLEERIAMVGSLLAELLPEWSWRAPEAGISAWIRLPVAEATRFARLARRMGVAVVPGSAASPTGAFEDHIRVSLGPDTAVIEDGVRRLAAAWRVFAAEGAGDRHEITAMV